MPNEYLRTSGFFPGLNGLRGVAVLAVLVFHSIEWRLPGGSIGVDLFFVLSGFLITFLLLVEKENNGEINLGNFYLRRFIRLGPALFLLLFFFIVFGFAFLGHSKGVNHIVDSLVALFFMSNWARATGMHIPDWLGHTWSLSVEEQYYLLWPMLLIVCHKLGFSRRWILTMVLALAGMVSLWRAYLAYDGASIDRLYYPLDTHTDGLLVGCALGISVTLEEVASFIKKHFLLVKGLSLLAMGCIAIVALSVSNSERYFYYWALLLVELSAAFVIMDVLFSRKSIVKYVLETKVLVWVGSISYGLYLWHLPIFKAMGYFGLDRKEMFYYGISMAFTMASLSYYLVERPILKKYKNRYK